MFRQLLILTLTASVTTAFSQQRPLLFSPEINADGAVTFRYYAPKASKVELSAEFLKGNLPMQKVDSIQWSVTTGPVEPDIYPYFFVVDGVSVADPSNAVAFPNELFKRSIVDVPAKTPQCYDLQDVPHGTLSTKYYKANSAGLIRPLLIYTPPGYESSSSVKYPVLYLIHGRTDTQDAWNQVGRINFILDNLIAQGKAKPMIIVMPYSNAYPELQKKDKTIKADYLNTEMFGKDLLQDIIPFIENNYRVLTGSANRAIAGFSLGGRQTLHIGLANPNVFAYVCAYAPAVWKRELDETFTKTFAPANELNSKVKLLWLSVGKTDFLYQSGLDLQAAFDERKIKYKSLYSEGGHTWMNVRDYVTETVPMLFR